MTAEVSQHELDVPGGRGLLRGTRFRAAAAGGRAADDQRARSAPMADLLAEDHTVVTYDPRGVGKSTVDDPSLPVTPEIEGDDLALVVDAVGGGPADVFGSSGGAVAGLAMAAHHPDTVGR